MSQPATPLPDDRPLTEHERHLTRWMLEHGTPEAAFYVEQIEHARVVSRCSCGCASIDFSIDNHPKPTGNMEILADFEFGGEDHLCGAFVFAQDGLLAGLEVYGLAVEAPRELPALDELRPLSREV